MTTVNDLDAKKKAMEDAIAVYEAAKKVVREQDLKTVKELIKRHEFKNADLKPELKTTRAGANETSGRKS